MLSTFSWSVLSRIWSFHQVLSAEYVWEIDGPVLPCLLSWLQYCRNTGSVQQEQESGPQTTPGPPIQRPTHRPKQDCLEPSPLCLKRIYLFSVYVSILSRTMFEMSPVSKNSRRSNAPANKLKGLHLSSEESCLLYSFNLKSTWIAILLS